MILWILLDTDVSNTFGVNAEKLRQKGGLFSKIVHERLDSEKTLWVEYERFGLLAIKGIQELTRKYERLKEELQVSKEEIKSLKKRLDKLENIYK